MKDTASELRADIARHQLRYYRLAPYVGLHPTRLGEHLSGRRPLYPELIERIRRAIERELASREREAAASTPRAGRVSGTDERP